MTRRANFAVGGIHYFTIHARPRPGSRLATEWGGAFVNCWISFRLQEGALVLAKYYIRGQGWLVRSVQEHRWINRAIDLPPGSRRFFREAQTDGACFEFHFYPKSQGRAGRGTNRKL